MDDDVDLPAESDSNFFTFDITEYESMTFGDSVMVLIAIGVLLYLIYALLWPEHF
jgi:K+-transporting ATPase KdpF subunit